MCLLLSHDGGYFTVIQDENVPVFIDKRIKKVDEIRLNEVSSNMKLKYRKSFNFEFDEERETNEQKITLMKPGRF